MSNEHGPSPEAGREAELAEIDAKVVQLGEDLTKLPDNDQRNQTRISRETATLLRRRKELDPVRDASYPGGEL
jgi:hypothetical protein